jgi:membrane protein
MIDRARQIWASLDAWMDRYRVTRVTRRSIGGFLRHEALVNAGSMAYFAILSLFQILVLAVVMLSFFLGEGSARTYVLDTTVNNTPIDRATAASVIDAVISSRGGISLVSGVLLLWSALAAFSALNKGIARAFVAAAPRPFWRDKLVGLGVMATAGSLTVAAILLGFAADFVVAVAGDAVSQVPGGGFALDMLSLLIPILLIFGVFLAVYRITPNRPVTLREVWPGAVVATILWTLLRIGFTYYSTHIARYDSAFGPISTGVSLLVFLYFASVVVLLGAEVARANVLEDAFQRPPPVPVEAMLPSPQAPPARYEPAAPAAAPLGEDRLPRWSMRVGGVVAGGVVRWVSLRIAARRRS